jgi:hypothetical protein
MNYYLIWTEEGWLRTPTYNHVLCSGVVDLWMHGIDSTINTTRDIKCAYKLREEQAKECLEFLHKCGVNSWAIEVKEDMMQDLLKELKQKAKGDNNGN